jgi:hypothetical protein
MLAETVQWPLTYLHTICWPCLGPTVWLASRSEYTWALAGNGTEWSDRSDRGQVDTTDCRPSADLREEMNLPLYRSTGLVRPLSTN